MPRRDGATQLSQQVSVFCRPHILGRRRGAQFPGQVRARFQCQAGRLLPAGVGDEKLVALAFGDGNSLELPHGRTARAIVICAITKALHAHA